MANINKVLYFPFLEISSIDPMFLGFNLALSPQKAGNWFYYLVPVVTAGLQYAQTVMTMKSTQAAPQTTKGDEKKEDMAGDFQKAMNTQMRYIFPVMIGWFAYTLPVGMSLYWNIFSIFSIVQYQQLKTKSIPALEIVMEEGAQGVDEMRASKKKKKKSSK